MADGFADGRILVVAFEGWNDAGEAASAAARILRDAADLELVSEVESEDYFDYTFNRPMVSMDDDGEPELTWPGVGLYGPVDRDEKVWVLLGVEPSRGWKTFSSEIMDQLVDHGITGIVMLGALLADVPHTRPISISVTSNDGVVRREHGYERSTYEGPVGILSVLSARAQLLGIPTISIWASVPHYVHNSPSPKATLAIVEKLESVLGTTIPRGDLVEESAAWESGIDAIAGDDDDMSSYIEQLEQARDTVDSPEASGEAIAQEFERYLRRRDGRPGSSGPGEEPWRPE